MPHRQFRDVTGSVWDVWDVYPSAMERRLHERRTLSRRKTERRLRAEVRATGVPADLKMGWLAFQLGRERRRLVPIPQDWMDLPEDELRVLKERAVVSERLR